MNEAIPIRACLQSVVLIKTADGIGSGFYASGDGVIATCQHVVGRHASVEVRRHDRTRATVHVITSSPGLDLVLLLDRDPGRPPPLKLGDPAAITAGTPVFAIGHPRGLDYTLTRGVVSSAHRQVSGASHVQTDAVIHPGSSGGPLLNTDGEVIGVSTFVTESPGLNFALSVRYVHELLGQVIVTQARARGATPRSEPLITFARAVAPLLPDAQLEDGGEPGCVELSIGPQRVVLRHPRPGTVRAACRLPIELGAADGEVHLKMALTRNASLAHPLALVMDGGAVHSVVDLPETDVRDAALALRAHVEHARGLCDA